MGKGNLTSMRYLHIVPYQDLPNWSVAHILGNDLGFTNRYPIVSIGVLLKPSRNIVIIKDNVEYKQVTLKTNGGGAVLRGIKLGKDIGTKKQYRVSEGQFIMSKIDARNGAFGIVSGDLNGAVVTGDFPVFDVVNEKLNPSYLQLLSSTKPFIRFAQSCSRGTTNRQRIDVKQFLDMQIPLPSLKEQNAIVAAYYNLLVLADQYEQQSVAEGYSIQQYISQHLGLSTITNKKDSPKTFMYLTSLQELSVRWDVWNIINSCYNGKYGLVSLSKVIKMSSGQFLPSKSQIAGQYIVYGGNGKTGTHKKYCYSGKRIVIGRVGEYCGNVHLVDGAYWITDNALKVDKINDNITWEYLAIVLSALNINQYKSVSAQPSISQKKILQLQIPLPPIDVQNEIVKHVDEQKAMINQLKQKAQDTRKKAEKDFESKIFE